MIIIPAIDLIDGKPVRLKQGDYSRKQSVAEDALEQAALFEKDGAELLHVVDLDGARLGKPVNHQLILEVARSLDIPVEIGGGLRRIEDLDLYLKNGLERVILGSAALQDQKLLKEALDKYGERIVLGLDCLDGKPRIHGWKEGYDLNYLDVLEMLGDKLPSTIIFTDISTDGMLSGPNLEALEKLRKNYQGKIIASGGIHTLEDIDQLKKLDIDGCIIGKALYDHAIDLKEAIEHAG